MRKTNSNLEPLVLLDVDGVINDLGALGGTPRPWTTEVVQSHGYRLLIPDYMRSLVNQLVDSTEVWWCTTWRDRANDELAEHLGVGNLPVVTDGSNSRFVDWKAKAARPLVIAALEEGREVFWIEDFYGDPPINELPNGVTFVDTTVKGPRGVLSRHDLPRSLRRWLPSWDETPRDTTMPSSDERVWR